MNANKRYQPTLTLTGVDEHVPMALLRQVIEASLLTVELGFLYSATPEGRTRYPVRTLLERLLLQGNGVAALHVCGSIARSQLLQGELGDLIPHVRRIQVNGTLSAHEVGSICDAYPDHRIITQHTDANAALLAVAAPNHQVLVDRSGGRGISPDSWERPETEKDVGFAGGLGPHNLDTALPAIRAVARGRWWIDMEASLRSAEDRFDIERARQVIDQCNAYEGALRQVHNRRGKGRVRELSSDL